MRTFVRAYERASKKVYVVLRHHVLKFMAYFIAFIYIIVCLYNILFCRLHRQNLRSQLHRNLRTLQGSVDVRSHGRTLPQWM